MPKTKKSRSTDLSKGRTERNLAVAVQILRLIAETAGVECANPREMAAYALRQIGELTAL
jgi:hypothetical protein